MNLKLLSYLPFAKLSYSLIMPSSSLNPYTSTYDRMSGNCTRLVAAHIVSTISPPITSSSYILDSACGTGIVSEQIKLQCPEARIMATDLSPAMIEETKRRIETEGWTNMQTDILDVRSLSTLPDSTFTHVIINFGLLAPGDPGSAIKVTREVFRVLKPSGVAVLSTWTGMSLSTFHRHEIGWFAGTAYGRVGTRSISELEFSLWNIAYNDCGRPPEYDFSTSSSFPR